MAAVGFYSLAFYVLYAALQGFGNFLGVQSSIGKCMWMGVQNLVAYDGTSVLAKSFGFDEHANGCRGITALLCGLLGWVLDDLYLGMGLLAAVGLLPY